MSTVYTHIQPTRTSSTDVLIVGAGPVGLTMASELLRRGVHCRIIDQASDISDTSRALAIHSRTLEIFENMGIVEEVLSKGAQLHGITIHEDTRTLLHIDLDLIKDTNYPYLLALPQNNTERILNKHLNATGGTVERECMLVDMFREPTGVRALVEHRAKGAATSAPGSAKADIEEIHADWLIGCDGAHSTVRKLSGMPFMGKAYPEHFLLADAQLIWNMPHNAAQVWLSKVGILAVFPIPGNNHWRIIMGVQPAEENTNITARYMQHLIEERIGNIPVSVDTLTWTSHFKISQRITQHYQEGRIFLMGDAAHIHSPVGGQGMNTGIHDAFNLAWKLALVIQNKSPETLLNSYEEERRPVGKMVLNETGLGSNALFTTNPLVSFLRNNLLLPLLKTETMQSRLGQRISELPINYRHSYLSYMSSGPVLVKSKLLHEPMHRSFRVPPDAGDRAPDALCIMEKQQPMRLFEIFRGIQSHILIFPGEYPTSQDYLSLADVARNTQSYVGLPELLQIYLVIPGPGTERPPEVSEGITCLYDPQFDLHVVYGARKESLYFIRPDGYIGLRSRPVNMRVLLDYLGRIYYTAQTAKLTASA